MKRNKCLWASKSVPCPGMCFYIKGDLEKGNNYQLLRDSDNPKDTNCFKVSDEDALDR